MYITKPALHIGRAGLCYPVFLFFQPKIQIEVYLQIQIEVYLLWPPPNPPLPPPDELPPPKEREPDELPPPNEREPDELPPPNERDGLEELLLPNERELEEPLLPNEREGLEELDLSNDLVVLLEEPDLSNERDGVDWVLLGVLKLLFDEEPPVLPNERDGLVVLLLAPGVLRVLLWRVVPDMLFCVRFSLPRAPPMLVAPVLGVALMLRLPRVVSKLRLLPTPLPLPLP